MDSTKESGVTALKVLKVALLWLAVGFQVAVGVTVAFLIGMYIAWYW